MADQTSLAFDKPTTCGWCLDQPATMLRYGTPSCITCGCGTPSQRVQAWLNAVKNRITGQVTP